MRVLVTGASGLLGANVVRSLIAFGEDVRILVRPTSDLRAISNLTMDIRFGDIKCIDSVRSAMKDCDAVVHAASLASQWGISYREYEEVNVRGTLNILQVAQELGNLRVVLVSTANAIGRGSKLKPGNEMSSFNLFSLNSGYINTKFLAQQYAQEAVEKYGANVVVINPAFIIGPYDIKPSSGQLLLYACKNKVQLCPPGGKSFVHVSDVTKAIYMSLFRGQPGECYLLAAENLSYYELFSMINSMQNKRGMIIKISKGSIKVLGLLSSFWSSISGRFLKLNKSNLKMACLDNYYTGEKASKEFDITYTPIRMAVQEALTWFEENNYL